MEVKPIFFWIRKEDLPTLDKIKNVRRLDISEYNSNLGGQSTIRYIFPDSTDGIFGKLNSQFVLGRINLWVPRGENDKRNYDEGVPFIKIKKGSCYSTVQMGMVLSPYDYVDLIFHLKAKPIDQRECIQRVGLLGDSSRDLVDRGFWTYKSAPGISHKTPRDTRFLIYTTLDLEQLLLK
jgi:hypothetical protein